MRPGTRTLAMAIMALLFMASWVAPADGAQVSLGSDVDSFSPPRVIVDSIGAGYSSWASGAAGEALQVCRLAPHAKRCEAPHTFPFPGVDTSTDSGNAPVFTAGGRLAVLDSRCCLFSNQKMLLLSSDHGTTFTGPTPILADAAGGMSGNLLDFPAGAFGAGSPEELLSSNTNAVTGGGSIQATGLAPAATDPGWFTPQVPNGTLSESLGHAGSTILAVYTSPTTPNYTTWWVRYQGGDPNAHASWSAPQPLSPLPSLDSNAQLASGAAGIFVARSIATPGDNERLVVQRFTGAGWSSPTAITNAASGERFGITETPAGRVYVVWKDNDDDALHYAVAGNRTASRFRKSVKLATRGEIEFPQIAVNSEGAGWVTWTNDGTPTRVSALPIVPRPRVTRSGPVSLRTPRECVAVGASFPVSLAVSRHTQLAGVHFSVAGGKTAAVSHSPFHATLRLTSAAKAAVVVRVRVPTKHGHTRTKSIRAPLIACP